MVLRGKVRMLKVAASALLCGFELRRVMETKREIEASRQQCAVRKSDEVEKAYRKEEKAAYAGPHLRVLASLRARPEYKTMPALYLYKSCVYL